MAQFRIIVRGRYEEPVDERRGAVISDALRRVFYDAGSVRDTLDGEFEFVMIVDRETENEAQALGRAAVASALFDAGFSCLTAPILEVSTSTHH